MGLYTLDQNDCFPRRDYRLYARGLNEDSTHSVENLAARDVYIGDNAVYDLYLDNDCDLPKPDILHTLRLGMLKHLLA
jgi:hypothetical protein